MDGREVEKDITKWTEEVITGGDQKRNRKEKEALKKWMSCSINQQADVLFALTGVRMNPLLELYSMFSV